MGCNGVQMGRVQWDAMAVQMGCKWDVNGVQWGTMGCKWDVNGVQWGAMGCKWDVNRVQMGCKWGANGM